MVFPSLQSAAISAFIRRQCKQVQVRESEPIHRGKCWWRVKDITEPPIFIVPTPFILPLPLAWAGSHCDNVTILMRILMRKEGRVWWGARLAWTGLVNIASEMTTIVSIQLAGLDSHDTRSKILKTVCLWDLSHSGGQIGRGFDDMEKVVPIWNIEDIADRQAG